MHQNMNMPIIRLERELWNSCVRRLAADSKETAAKWQNDPAAYMREGFTIKPIPSHLEPLLEQVLTQWKEVEQKLFSTLKMTREEFLEEFEKARSTFLSGNYVMGILRRCGRIFYGVVTNMDIVNLFAWILPAAANPERREELRMTGRTVLAIFYTETLFSRSEAPGVNDEIIRKLETLWSLVS